MSLLSRSLFALFLLLGAKAAQADTLQFVSADMPGYPFQFSVNGATANTNLMCLDINRHVTAGEKWNVNIAGIPLDNSRASIAYRADAWIFSLVGGAYSNADLQYAAWSIFDLKDTYLAGGYDSTVARLRALAFKQAQNAVLIDSGFFSAFRLYLPTSDTSGWTSGVPQRYIGVAMTPEPGSLMLMLTGSFMGGCLFLYRRRQMERVAVPVS